jgi:hypothetical protein
MGRLSNMVVPAILFAIALAGCGGRESVASKSAAAYREAQAKGVPVGGGHEHGGHEASTTTKATANAVASVVDPHAGHDMTARGKATDHTAHRAGSAVEDHASMGHGASAATHASAAQHAGHKTSTATADPHAGHAMTTTPTPHAPHQAPRASGSDPHAQHRTVPSPPDAMTLSPGIQPGAALTPDAFDAPAPASVAEAARAAQGGGHEGHAPSAAPKTTVVYTCPMHPEVTSDAPGTCPKCGMALVKKP